MTDSSNNQAPFPDDEPGAVLDLTSFAAVIRRRPLTLLAIAGVALVISLAIGFLATPQSYTSQISLSFPQSAQPIALSLLSGSGGTGSRYIGVLRSRRFAEEVARRARVKERCGYRTDEEAIEALTKGLNVNDNVRDNLVYVAVTLPGPAKFAPGSSAARDRVKNTAADAANAYADSLRRYMATSDTDRESILLRAANEQLARARRSYETSVARLTNFVTRPGAESYGTVPDTNSQLAQAGRQNNTGTAESANQALSSTAARELESLYIERGKLAADIQSASAASDTSRRLRSAQLTQVDSLPDEDPLLTSARADVNQARQVRDSLALQFGPDHPEYIKAQKRLQLAEQTLARQKNAVARQETSDDISLRANLKSLEARSATVNQYISAAEKKAQRGLLFSQQFERRRNDVLLQLEVLKSTAAQAATLSLQSVSVKNRMAVIDYARPAPRGAPGGMMIILGSIVASALVAAGAAAIMASRRKVAAGMAGA